MRLLIYTANLGNFDKTQRNVEQLKPDGVDSIEYWRCTDQDFPSRFNSMTPRLQARIVKMTAWQMKPDFDYYLWVDSSMQLSKEDSADWFMNQLDTADMAVFRHNKRQTVQEEADYLEDRLKLEMDMNPKDRYVTMRYENERLQAQMAAVNPDDELYATTAFIWRNNLKVRDCLALWWLHTSLYHSIDQLSLPKAISDSGLEVNVIDEDYLKCEYMERIR